MPDVEQGVLLIIAKVAKKEPSELKMETRLAEELMLKSMSKGEMEEFAKSLYSPKK